jgi:DNA polymerase sigma
MSHEKNWLRYFNKIVSNGWDIPSLSYGDLRVLHASLSSDSIDSKIDNLTLTEKEEDQKLIQITEKLKSISCNPFLQSNHSIELIGQLDNFLFQSSEKLILDAQIQQEKAEKVIIKLQKVIQTSLSDSQYRFIDLKLFGSTANKLALGSSSDLDFTLFVECPTLDRKKLFQFLTTPLSGNGFTIQELVLRARVPILRLKDEESDFEVKIFDSSPSHSIDRYFGE